MHESEEKDQAGFDSFQECEEAKRLRDAWQHAPPEPVLSEFLNPTVLADELLLAQVIVADAESRLQRGDSVGLDRYLSLVPELKSGSEGCVQLLLLELMQNVEDPTSALAALHTKYGPAFHMDIQEAAGFVDTFSPTLSVGAQLGKYQLNEKLGEGSFGQVWRAWDRELERYVALKLFSPGEDTFRQMRKLREEVRAASGINHPNVIGVRTAGRFLQSSIATVRGWLFIDMELCGDAAPRPDDPKWIDVGQALPQIALTKQGLPKFTPRQAAQMTADLCRGVHQAHIQRVVHCDIKPGNVLVTPSGRAMIADFGLSSSDLSEVPIPLRHRLGSYDVHHTTVMVIADGKRIRGAPPYMSPEQARGETLNILSDVYALGAVLYFLLSGRHPYESILPPPVARESAAQNIIVQVADPNALPKSLSPEIPIRLRQICAQAMQKSPSSRYTSASEMADELRAWLSHQPTLRTLPRQSRSEVFALWAMRNSFVAGLLVTVFIALICGIAGTTWQAVRARRAERNATALATSESQQRQRAEQNARNERLQLIQTLNAQADALLGSDVPSQALSAALRSHSLAEGIHADTTRGDLVLTSILLASPPPLYSTNKIDINAQHIRQLPDHYQALMASNMDVLVVDMLTGSVRRRLKAHQAFVSDLAISKDGSIFASSDGDGKVLLWSASEGRKLREIKLSNTGQVYSIAFSPTAPILAAVFDDQLVTLDVRDLSIIHSHHLGDIVQSVDFSPDGRFILVPADNGTWHRLTADTLQEVSTGTAPHERARCILSFPDGESFLVGTDIGVERYVVTSDKGILFYPCPSISRHLAISSSGELFAVGTGSVRLFDVATGKLEKSLSTRKSASSGLLFDQDVLIEGGEAWPLNPLHFPTPVSSEIFYNGSIRGTAVTSPDSLLALFPTRDHYIGVLDLATGLPLANLHGDGAMTESLTFSPDGTRLYSIDNGGNLSAWNWPDFARLPAHRFTEKELWGFDLSPDQSSYAVSGAQSPLEIRNLSDHRIVATFPIDIGEAFRSAEFSHDGSQLLANDGFQGRLFDVRRGKEVSIWPYLNVFRNTIFSHDSSAIIYGDAQGNLTRHNIADGKENSVKSLPGMIRALALSHDGSLLAAGGQDGAILFSDPQNLAPLATLRGFPGQIYQVAFTPDSHYLLAICIRDARRRNEGELFAVDLHTGPDYLALHDKAQAARTVLDTRPNDRNALLTLGLYYAHRRADSWAVELLTRARTLGADVPSLPLARAYWQLHQLPQAKQEFQRALDRKEAPEYYLQLCINAVENPPTTAPATTAP